MKVSNQADGGWPGSGPCSGPIKLLSPDTGRVSTIEQVFARFYFGLGWSSSGEEIVFITLEGSLVIYSLVDGSIRTLDESTENHVLYSFPAIPGSPAAVTSKGDVFYVSTDFVVAGGTLTKSGKIYRASMFSSAKAEVTTVKKPISKLNIPQQNHN